MRRLRIDGACPLLSWCWMSSIGVLKVVYRGDAALPQLTLYALVRSRHMNRRTPAAILFLEDCDESRADVVEALRTAGFHVTPVADSQAARPLVHQIRPRVIVASMDARTRADRVMFCREIRSDARTARIPLLLTTDCMTEEDVCLATDPGALVLMMTRDDDAKLVAAIQGVLAAQRAEPLSASARRRRDVKWTA
jgi:DNA-binding response OmpR family regulator